MLRCTALRCAAQCRAALRSAALRRDLAGAGILSRARPGPGSRAGAGILSRASPGRAGIGGEGGRPAPPCAEWPESSNSEQLFVVQITAGPTGVPEDKKVRPAQNDYPCSIGIGSA